MRVELRTTRKVAVKTKNGSVNLKNALYVKSLQSNFISVAKAVEKGYKVIFHKQSAYIKAGSLFVVDTSNNRCTYLCANDELWKWHYRYGHLNMASLKKMTVTIWSMA